MSDDYSACLAIGHALYNRRFEGLVAESARPHGHLRGKNIVLFGPDGHFFERDLDPVWRLESHEDEAGQVVVTAYPLREGMVERVGDANRAFRGSKA